MPHKKPKRTYVRMRELRSVFNSSSPSQLDAQTARLCVLYEDLRIELMGMHAGSLRKLDTTSKTYRQHYFLRRSIVTLLEFSELVRHIEGLREFVPMRQGFGADGKKWDRAVRFFRAKDQILRQVRNDVGGHFHLGAAQYAIQSLGQGLIGKIEAESTLSGKAIIKLHFAAELAATALFQHVQGADSQARARKLIRVVFRGWSHATRIADLIVRQPLWKRFGH